MWPGPETRLAFTTGVFQFPTGKTLLHVMKNLQNCKYLSYLLYNDVFCIWNILVTGRYFFIKKIPSISNNFLLAFGRTEQKILNNNKNHRTLIEQPSQQQRKLSEKKEFNCQVFSFFLNWFFIFSFFSVGFALFSLYWHELIEIESKTLFSIKIIAGACVVYCTGLHEKISALSCLRAPPATLATTSRWSDQSAANNHMSDQPGG